MKKCITLFILIALFYLPSAFAAQVDAYQVEVIVFSQITPENLALEHWKNVGPMRIPTSALDLTPEQILPPSQWRLKNIQQVLLNNHNPVILHIAWQENSDGMKAKRLFHLTGGETYANELMQMNGILALKLQRYFDITFFLQFLMPIDPTNKALARYNLIQKLRMRSNELNYIDHPLYGIFIEIFPLTPSTNMVG